MKIGSQSRYKKIVAPLGASFFLSSLLILQGCTYLGEHKPGEDKLEFDLHELGISNDNKGPLQGPKPEDAHMHGAWADVGNKYERQQDYTHAVEAFKKCTELAPGEKFYWDSLANNYKRLDKFEESRAAFLEGLSLSSNDFYTMAAIAYADEQLAKDRESLMYYLSAVSLRPDFEDAWKGIASTLHRVGLDKYLPKAEKLRGNGREPYGLSVANEINEEYLSTHGENDPLYWGHFLNRGYFAMKYMKAEEAEAVFNETIAKRPAQSLEAKRASSGLCILYTTIGKDKEALEMIEKAAANTPKDPDIWYCSALIYRRRGDFEQALRDLGKATSFAPDRAGWSKLFQTWLAEAKEREKLKENAPQDQDKKLQKASQQKTEPSPVRKDQKNKKTL